MNGNELATPVGELVRVRPRRAEVFDALEVDYCCAGYLTLDRVCAQRGLDAAVVVDLLEATDEGPETGDEPKSASLSGLCDAIEREHHSRIRSLLSRARGQLRAVRRLRAVDEAQLGRLSEVIEILDKELRAHIAEEAETLFPLLRRLEANASSGAGLMELSESHVAALEHDHESVGDALSLIRGLTDGFRPPTGACDSVITLYGLLWELSLCIRRQVHVENNVLFPRAVTVMRGTMG